MTDQNAQYILATLGTAGDVYPFIGLAEKLRDRGQKVTLLGSEFHGDLFRASKLPFVSIGTIDDYQRRFNNPDLWNPSKGFAALFAGLRLPLGQMVAALRALQTKQRCVIVAHQIALPAAAIAREAGVGIQVVGAYLAPSNLRTCHDPLNLGSMHIPAWVPIAWRRLLWRALEAGMINPIAVPEVNAVRAQAGLPTIKGYLQHVADVPDASVMLVPDWFAKPHPDWPAPLRMADFPLYDPSAGRPLPPDLTRFLSSADKAVVFTPGTGHMHAASTFRRAAAACARLGRRAIFLTPHRAQVPAELPDSIHWQSHVSLKSLLPHAAALVHHGGIGTTAEALRAGVPQLVMPFAWDQFDNGARVQALGVGQVIPAQGRGASRLAPALETLLASGAVQAACKRVAERFKTGADSDKLCRDIEEMLGITAPGLRP